MRPGLFLDVRRTIAWTKGRVRQGPPESNKSRRVEIPPRWLRA